MKILLTSDTHYGYSEGRTGMRLNYLMRYMKKQSPDIILHAGDWGMTDQIQYVKCLKLFRRYFPDIPIIGVDGNHDFYDGTCSFYGKPTETLLPDLVKRHEELHSEYNILKHFKTDNVEIFAYNSWYNNCVPPSNDKFWIPIKPFKHHEEMHQYFIERSYLACCEICEKLKASTAKNKIVVTHFETIGEYRGSRAYEDMKGSYTEFLKLVEAGANIICYGHSHRLKDEKYENNVQIYNAGSDYNRPAYIEVKLS